MRDTIARQVDSGSAPGPPADAPEPEAPGTVEMRCPPRAARRRALPVAACVGVSALATALAFVLSRRLCRSAPAAGAPAAPGQSRPAAPTSAINVNWGFALFGTNVIAASRPVRRLPTLGGLRRRLSRR